MRQRGGKLRIGASRMTRVGGGRGGGSCLSVSTACVCVDARLALRCGAVVVDTVVAAAVTCDMSLYVCEKVSQKE